MELTARSTATDCEDVLELFHPIVGQWFRQSFGQPTSAQQQAWPSIAAGEHTLLLAPTGSGKTLAAFLIAIDRLLFPPGNRGGDRPRARNEPGCQDRTSKARKIETSIDANRRQGPADQLANSPAGVRLLYLSPLKALGVDVERNLRAPLAGVRALAEREGHPYRPVRVGIRTGDTPSPERRLLQRDPPEILITTPESLYLMLTSRARDTLVGVQTIILDEIHSVAATKRGSHLALSLERLERLQNAALGPLQRIGLSATQRPLAEIARLLGGAQRADHFDPRKSGADLAHAPIALQPRPVRIVEAGRRKQLQLTVEVPFDQAPGNRPARPESNAEGGSLPQEGPAASRAPTDPVRPSIWDGVHRRLVDLIGQHRSTMVFVNSRRLAERLATAINELAQRPIAAAHHGSVSKETRLQIEDQLKRGELPAIVATSSLELGIDMGAVDLVVQIEAPPSIASGIQRVGRAGHQVGAPSTGILFPKHRHDLLTCTAASERMQQGEVEPTCYPRNPLDVLAQQIVAIVATETLSVDELYDLVRQAAPFADLPLTTLQSVLDLLSGRYPSDEFSSLRPRILWDRSTGRLTPRKGARLTAITNGGTIPDRGLYGVFLVGDDKNGASRVGELDEEMVFELQVGEVFLLGASAWQVEEITHDRVLVRPAPGQTGKMPFWRGEGPGRPLEFGRAVGHLTRQLADLDGPQATMLLTDRYRLDRQAAEDLIRYVHDQRAATGQVPSDRTVVIESMLDEVGDWRVVLLSPFGGRVHAPWAMAVAASIREQEDAEVDMIWTDDGIVFRLSASDQPPPADRFLPAPETVQEIVVRELGSSALFAGRFRENAGRALLLPKWRPGRRTPLWLQRRKSADLLRIVARYENFPIVLETYRECLHDVFDMQGLIDVLRDITSRKVRVRSIVSDHPSPFARSVLFHFAGNYIYDGDAPLAERRAAALALDHGQLRELLGDAQLRELLCPATIESTTLQLQRLDGRYPLGQPDDVHELLRMLGDLTLVEIQARLGQGGPRRGKRQADGPAHRQLDQWLEKLIADRRIVRVPVAGEPRLIAVEDIGRYRDALDVVPPAGLPQAFLEPVDDPLADLVSRYGRTHGPFTPQQVAERLGLDVAIVRGPLERLALQGRLLSGEFLPGGHGTEWCDAQVLRVLKRRSVARLRKQVEPVEPDALARFLAHWQRVAEPRTGLDALLDVVEQLQGTPLAASVLEHEILPARIREYRPADLDELCLAGEVVWQGCESLGTFDGRIALYLTDQAPRLAPAPQPLASPLQEKLLSSLQGRGGLRWDELQSLCAEPTDEILSALWQLVWLGHVTNDTLGPLRSLFAQSGGGRSRVGTRAAAAALRSFRSRRTRSTPGSEGRWRAFSRADATLTPTERQTSLAWQLTARLGIVTRELVASHALVGGFAGIYPVFKAMEEAGRVRRGYFIVGQGAAQFALPGADDLLREHRQSPEQPTTWVLAATDPANPYGTAVPWPKTTDAKSRPQRSAGARVILHNGQLIGYLNANSKHLLTFFNQLEDDARDQTLEHLTSALAMIASPQRPIRLEKIDGQSVRGHAWEPCFLRAGFIRLNRSWLSRGAKQSV